MSALHLEVERKFDVDPEFALPDLCGLEGVAGVDPPVEHRLEAVYHDTDDLRLIRSRITLRRRTGGTDAGWHLKLPAEAGARQERHEPLGRAVKAPPKALRDVVAGVVRRSATLPVAQLRTSRTATVLRDDQGRALAEVADDTVTASAPAAEPGGPAELLAWREVEVELVDGDEQLLERIGERLVAAGARPSASSSKLGRVLAARLAFVGSAAAGAERFDRNAERFDRNAERFDRNAERIDRKKKSKKKGKAGTRSAGRRATGADVVLAAVRAQVEALQTADLMIRTEQDDAVHKFRVACRRLRSILAAYRSVLRREATDPLRAELRWLGEQLSDARDGEVALAHLRELVGTQPPELVLGPVAARLQQSQVQEHQRGAERAKATLADGRYVAILDALYGLLADPPLAEEAGTEAGQVLRDAVRRTGRRLSHRIDDARQAGPDDVGHALHELRKAAKRVRYTAEVAAGELGRPATDLVACMEQVQEVLGERQDSEVTRELCLRLGREAFAVGENPWTFGRLHGLEEVRAERAEAAFWALEPTLHPVLRAARKKG